MWFRVYYSPDADAPIKLSPKDKAMPTPGNPVYFSVDRSPVYILAMNAGKGAIRSAHCSSGKQAGSKTGSPSRFSTRQIAGS